MKDKMRCARCGKTFKPARSSQTLCDQCEKQERAARAAARNVGGGAAIRPSSIPAAQPVKIVGPAAGLLDPSAAASVVSGPSVVPPPETGLYGSAAIREEQRREQQRREQQRREEQRHAEERARDEARRAHQERAREEQRRAEEHTPHGGAHAGAPNARRGPKPNAPRGERPAPTPRAPKVPRPAPPRFELTDELRAKIEARYLELAQPIEFDGIRTRIATELEIPKSAVKRAVADLRTRMQLPSWWELQSYSGAETDLERIRMAYVPHLPVPDVGIHKTLAEELNLDPRTVYQGIRRIRAEMRLPQYNAPEAHGDAPINAQANEPAADATTSAASATMSAETQAQA